MPSYQIQHIEGGSDWQDDLSMNAADKLWKRLNTRNENLTHGAVHMTKQDLEKCWELLEKPSSEVLAAFDEVYIYTDESPIP